MDLLLLKVKSIGKEWTKSVGLSKSEKYWQRLDERIGPSQCENENEKKIESCLKKNLLQRYKMKND